MKRIIRVEGYKAFHGIMKINYANPELAKANGMDSEILGDWLYKQTPTAGTVAATLSRLTGATFWR